MASARWLVGGRTSVVEVEVPPGPLGIMLDGDDLDRPVLEGFAQVSSDPAQRGTVELSGRVGVGSVLVAVNEYDFVESDLSFDEVGVVLRETSHLPRTLKFQVPVPTNVPLSQQFAPRRGPPPREEEEEEEEESDDDVLLPVKTPQPQMQKQDSTLPLNQQFAPRRGPPPREEEEEEEEESDDDGQMPFKQTQMQTQVLKQDSTLPLNQQFAPRRGPPPREEEEDEEDEGDRSDHVASNKSSSAEDSFQEIQVAETDVILASAVHAAEDQGSDGSTSWTLTGSNLDGSSNTPPASNASSASPEKWQQVTVDESVQAVSVKPLQIEIDEQPTSLPTELSFGTMAKLAETRHFDSDDSSGDSDATDSDGKFAASNQDDLSWKPERKSKTPSTSSFFPEQPEHQSPQKSRQPLAMASNVSSGTIAASLMAQTNQFDRDDSLEEDVDAEYVTAVAPPGPLGLNLDGGVLDCAVVMGFVKLRDGSKGALERNGGIVPGSVIVRINGEDFSRASLNEVSMRLSELSQVPRTLVFLLPSKAQQEQRSNLLQPTVMHRTNTLPQFKEDFDKRRKFELALVMHYDRQVLSRRDCWFCIDAKWMARWVDFVCRGGPEPGPITNESLLHSNWRKMLAHDTPGRPDTAREGLVLMKDYRVVAPMVWCLFAELHGLGEAPLLARYIMDVHAEALSDGEVSKVLEVPRPKAAVLANELRDKCLVRPSRKR